MRIADVRELYRDSDPQSPERYAAGPNLIRCPDGSILLTERVGSEKNSADGTQRFWRSSNNGRTFSREQFPFSRTPAGAPGEFRTTHFSLIGPNRLAMLQTWMEHPAGGGPILNPKTEGLLPIHIAWAESSDSGRNWSQLRSIHTGQYDQPCGNGGIVRAQDGSLLAGFETYKHFDDSAPWSAQSAVVRSRDDGKAWEPPVIIAGDPEHQICYWDHHLMALQDGTLLDFLWCDDRRVPGISHLIRTSSNDMGETWTPPARIGINGQFSAVTQLPGGDLLMFYVVRSGNPSIRVRVGNADGTRWEPSDALVLYSQTDDDLNASRGKDFTEYLRTMGGWTFGWPTVVALSSDRLLAAYYQADGVGSVVRLAEVEL